MNRRLQYSGYDRLLETDAEVDGQQACSLADGGVAEAVGRLIDHRRREYVDVPDFSIDFHPSIAVHCR